MPRILLVDNDKDLRQFLENEQLRGAGPFADDEGALWVLEAETAEAAEELSKAIPMWRPERLSVGISAHSPIVCTAG